MIRGIDIAKTGFLSQEKKMDLIINNIANAETIGFKEDTMLVSSFHDQLLAKTHNSDAKHNPATPIGPLNAGIQLDEVSLNVSDGPLKITQRATDLAIIGEGFFVVDTPEGERYTRNGNFTLSADGVLVTTQGYPIMGEQGPIRAGSGQFIVDRDGWVTSDQGRDRLQIVWFNDPRSLLKQGDNLYAGQAQAQPETDENFTVRQGAVEMSNVDLTRQVVDMMDTQRQYEINQRVLRMMDERLGRSVNEIARF